MTKKILMTAANYWASPYHVGSHQFAKLFAKNGWEVLFVSDPISPFHFLMRNKEQVLERYDIYRGKAKSGYDNIKIYVPMALITPNERPLFNTYTVTNFWYKLTVPNVVRYDEELGFGEVDLLWFDSFVQCFWIDKIKYKKSILRVADKMEGFKKFTPHLKRLEEKLMNRVDHIIYTAKGLKDYLGDYKEKGIYIPNGVDTEHFLKSTKEMPEDLKRIPRPIAIYVGAIDEWFGADFLLGVAQKCDEISFVLIGSARIDISKLLGQPNIYYLGRRNYSEISKYMYNSDAGIITFDVQHPVVETANPLKLYEYMACGLPVVATKWKELELINSPTYLAADPNEFITKLRKALKEKNGDSYLKFARINTWEERFKRLISYVEF